MGWVDNPVCRTCHETFVVIAVQQLEQYVRRVRFGTLLVAAVIFTVPAALGAGNQSDSILHDPPPTSCQEGADYVAGVDANGDPVVPADVGAVRAPIPSQVAAPLANRRRGRDGGYVVLDGAQVERLINPPSCRN